MAEDELAPELTAAGWKGLSDRERIQLCLNYAREAKTLAETARPQHQQRYEQIARQWTLLAADIEAAGSLVSDGHAAAR